MTRRRTALVTGATGQDGVLLSELLVQQGYAVHALVDGRSPRLAALVSRVPEVEVWDGDVRDRARVSEVLNNCAPSEVYNLAALSSVGDSWGLVDEVMAVNAGGVVTLLEEIRRLQDDLGEQVRYYQASSSEMFGLAPETPQRETTPFHPRSPYAVSKVAAHFLAMNYRESYGMFTCSGILYNHESPLRPPRFVTRKISLGVAAIATGDADQLVLGDIDVSRDWGWAADYVRAMHLMMQADEPDDFIVATGVSHTLREFLDVAFASVGITDWSRHVQHHDPALIRPAEVAGLVGDATKARTRLGWEPTMPFEDMIRTMVAADVEAAQLAKQSTAR